MVAVPLIGGWLLLFYNMNMVDVSRIKKRILDNESSIPVNGR